ncbi:TPA: 4Fe-4S dicluster domain-containing protein [Candidatus Poribacteria bacterium]|nr:4Fe-4S dicluster domain-containing protein [Candidatus Poribacteria bacterium]
MANLTYLKNVVTLELFSDKCIGCGMCVTVCPHSVFVINDRKARILNHNACMECGACAQNCPSDAISVRSGLCGCASIFIRERKHGRIMRYFFKAWGYPV